MSISLKFKHIGTNTVKMLMPIVNNQNFLRYLTYLTDDPLALKTYDRNGQSVNQPDITTIPIGDTVKLTPFDPNIITESKIIVFFYPLKGDLSNIVGTDIYELVIACPLQYFILQGSGEFRPFMMAYEIAKMLDSQSEIAGVAKIEIKNWQIFKASDSNVGLSLLIHVKNGNKV